MATNATSSQAPRPVKTDATREDSQVRETFQIGSVRATVFTDGNVSLRRSYRTPQGEWKSTSTLRPSDIAQAIEALQKCLNGASTEATDSSPA